jgi:hypothetical protein
MNDDIFPTALAVVALFLGAMQGRLATVLSRATHPMEDKSLGAYTPIPILIGWLAVAVWAFRSWPWYWVVAAIVGFALASGLVVSRRMLRVWMLLRGACAVVIVGAAVVLWVGY